MSAVRALIEKLVYKEALKKISESSAADVVAYIERWVK